MPIAKARKPLRHDGWTSIRRKKLSMNPNVRPAGGEVKRRGRTRKKGPNALYEIRDHWSDDRICNSAMNSSTLVEKKAQTLNLINPATQYVGFSCHVPACSEASKRRCSTPTVSFDNAACGRAHGSLTFDFQSVRDFKNVPPLCCGSWQGGRPCPRATP
jgi:hypothetical protein